ncbi:hypothetical protein [Kushneria indalinina]|uniref:DUF4136 domain-containing protein n=1 Tax=Kushneria indalinina DSM 14324 TaxID=1122140 RepID=A0A3D9DW66_9GAMM|nr:hypothetical protein [Kushneria indalinina]REC94639.1 hypothetical protein C8D72_1465 [Kushneria indalinina DSM 14324]
MSSIQLLIKMSLLGLALTGCSALPSSQPLGVNEHALPASCYAEYSGTRLAQVRAIASALEAQGYEVRTSDVELGLVSAERIRRQPGLGATRQWRSSMGWFGSRRGGVMLGGGFGDPFDTFRSDPYSREQVAVSADGQRYLAVRSMMIVSPDGFVMDARPASPEPFCQQTHAAIEQALMRSGASL